MRKLDSRGLTKPVIAAIFIVVFGSVAGYEFIRSHAESSQGTITKQGCTSLTTSDAWQVVNNKCVNPTQSVMLDVVN